MNKMWLKLNTHLHGVVKWQRHMLNDKHHEFLTSNNEVIGLIPSTPSTRNTSHKKKMSNLITILQWNLRLRRQRSQVQIWLRSMDFFTMLKSWVQVLREELLDGGLKSEISGSLKNLKPEKIGLWAKFNRHIHVLVLPKFGGAQ